MRRFLASGWFPLVTVLVLGASTALAFALMKPMLSNAGSAFVLPLTIGGWVTGPVIALLSLLLIAILNLIRRITKLRRVAWLHAPVVFVGVLPWMLFAWQLVMHESRYMPLAVGVIDASGKPMFIGAFVTGFFVIVMFAISLLLPKRSR